MRNYFQKITTSVLLTAFFYRYIWQILQPVHNFFQAVFGDARFNDTEQLHVIRDHPAVALFQYHHYFIHFGVLKFNNVDYLYLFLYGRC